MYLLKTAITGRATQALRFYEDLLLLLVQRRGLMALDRQSGNVVWEQQIGVEYPYPTPVVAGDLLVSGGDSSGLLGEASHLTALQAISGEVVWDKPILPARYPTGLLVRDGLIFATTPGEKHSVLIAIPGHCCGGFRQRSICWIWFPIAEACGAF